MLQTTRYFLNNTESSQPCFRRKKRKCLHVWVKGSRIQTVGQESYWNKSGFHPYRFPSEALNWAFLSVRLANALSRPSTVHAPSPQLPPGQTLHLSYPSSFSSSVLRRSSGHITHFADRGPMPRICDFWPLPSVATTSFPASWAVRDASCLLWAELQMVLPSERKATALSTALVQAIPTPARSQTKHFKFKICPKSRLGGIMSKGLDLLRRRKRKERTDGYSPVLSIMLALSWFRLLPGPPEKQQCGKRVPHSHNNELKLFHIYTGWLPARLWSHRVCSNLHLNTHDA